MKLSSQPGRVYVTSFGPTQNWRQGEKPATNLAPFTRSAKSIFSKQFSTSLSSMLSFQSLEHVWLKLIWLNSSHNPEWLMVFIRVDYTFFRVTFSFKTYLAIEMGEYKVPAHGKLQRCQTLPSDRQITAETMLTYDLYKFAMAVPLY